MFKPGDIVTKQPNKYRQDNNPKTGHVLNIRGDKCEIMWLGELPVWVPRYSVHKAEELMLFDERQNPNLDWIYQREENESNTSQLCTACQCYTCLTEKG